MDIREDESFPRTPVALGVLTAIVHVAGFAMVGAWLALVLLDQPRASAAPRAVSSSCGVCGVVERVGEYERAGLQLSGDRGEGLVVLLAALGGAPMPGERRTMMYETSVLHDDGSVRIVRDTSAPQWKRGDRVKVIKGRVEPDFEAAATSPLASAAPGASQPGRTPSPALPAARAR